VNVAVGVLLGLSVAACWLGAVGFARLRAPLDRVHCVTFVNVAGGVALVAALLADGVSDRSLKILLVLMVNLVGGAAVSHMTGRAVTQRAGGA
jgi:multicomponent Na+:H+ antiporter subunit G